MMRLWAACRKTSVNARRSDDVGQNLPGTHRRQLIGIADQQQCRALRQIPKDRPACTRQARAGPKTVIWFSEGGDELRARANAAILQVA